MKENVTYRVRSQLKDPVIVCQFKENLQCSWLEDAYAMAYFTKRFEFNPESVLCT